jgi:UDP-N-acetylglucosamine--N-acetylmuramyl-(pentapeptide) pyrophosphoryl-undecaprenol N-acetylglucosamine transferase
MKILFAGGGTAGHVEPALAVARAWREKYPHDEILFIGTESGLESTLVPTAGFSLHHIPKVSIARRLSPSLLKVPAQLFRSINSTRKLLAGVDCAIGFGGYVSGPLYFAALMKRTPFVIHEQNARAGWANRVGAHWTRFCALSYPVSNRVFRKAELTGLPLRVDVLSALQSASRDWQSAREAAKREITKKYGLKSNQPLIFIFGGSQGSQAINKVIDEARSNLTEVSILHGVGKNNPIPPAGDSYVALPYIDEMAQCYLAADLLIARSGAVTCAEAAALARFSLFIPLPVGNGEQALNAASLVDAGRALILEQSQFTATWLHKNITSLVEESAKLPASGDASGATAVDKIVKMMERAAGIA